MDSLPIYFISYYNANIITCITKIFFILQNSHDLLNYYIFLNVNFLHMTFNLSLSISSKSSHFLHPSFRFQKAF